MNYLVLLPKQNQCSRTPPLFLFVVSNFGQSAMHTICHICPFECVSLFIHMQPISWERTVHVVHVAFSAAALGVQSALSHWNIDLAWLLQWPSSKLQKYRWWEGVKFLFSNKGQTAYSLICKPRLYNLIKYTPNYSHQLWHCILQRVQKGGLHQSNNPVQVANPIFHLYQVNYI